MGATAFRYRLPTDHPREYGENPMNPRVWWDARGSSPRIRGECGGGDVGGASAGIIPANTGRIRELADVAGAGGDHPREYGENSRTNDSLHTPAGSSPRIRGEYGLVAGPH